MPHPLAATWRSMIQRCHNPRNSSYGRYGARGIVVCDRWRNSFDDFVSDVGDKPSPIHTLDRKDNSGNYEPDNIRWATPLEQAANSKCPGRVVINGVTRLMTDVARENGIKPDTVRCRVNDGWPILRALTTPVRPKRKVAARRGAK